MCIQDRQQAVWAILVALGYIGNYYLYASWGPMHVSCTTHQLRLGDLFYHDYRKRG